MMMEHVIIHVPSTPQLLHVSLSLSNQLLFCTMSCTLHCFGHLLNKTILFKRKRLNVYIHVVFNNNMHITTINQNQHNIYINITVFDII
jgi:hypothetical protein